MFTGPIHILLVEDSPSDQLLATAAISETGLETSVQIAPDGISALAYLRRDAPFQGALRPDLIFLDLNLPRKSGREVLAEIKNSVDLRKIPVVVLTTSEDATDIERAYELHANCYIAKPIDFEVFKNVVRSTSDFWFNLVRLPGRAADSQA